MNSLTLYGGSTVATIQTRGAISINSIQEVNEGPIGSVPEHILEKILSYLIGPELESAAAVSRQWNKTMITGMIKSKTNKLHCLSRFLSKHALLSTQRQSLIDAGASMLSAKGLKKIYKAEKEWQHTVAEALNQLPEEDVQAIFESHKNHIQSSVPARRNSLSTPAPRQKNAIAVREIAMDLSKEGLVDLAHEVSEGIKQNVERSEALLSVSQELVDEGRIEDAMEAADEIPLQVKQADAFLYITQTMAKCRRISEAKIVAAKIPVAKQKKEAEMAIEKANAGV